VWGPYLPTRTHKHNLGLSALLSLVLHVLAAIYPQGSAEHLKAAYQIEFQALSFRRFQLGFDRVNLHRPTMSAMLSSAPATISSSTASRCPRYSGAN
jgi:hypothetical protein